MTAIYSTIKYSGNTVHIAKLPKADIRGSVVASPFGSSNDKRLPKDFTETISGYTEAIAINGGIFYTYESKTYAEGIEKSNGVNHQYFYMNCVSNFNEVMALGIGKNGEFVFDKQSNIIADIGSYYGAVTFCFGIMKNSARAEWGKSEHSSQYNCISGRTILGQDATHIYAISIAGTTGSTGLKGSQLYDLCKSLNLVDAGCFDGGGSVWMRVNGEYKNNTTRKVKNAVLVFSKHSAESENTEFRRVKCVKGTLNGGTEYPTRKTITSDWDRNNYKIKVGDILIFDDVQPIQGKPDCYFQISGGDRPDLIGRWFAYDKNYFD